MSPCYWGANVSLKVSLAVFCNVLAGAATLGCNPRFYIFKITQNLFFSHVFNNYILTALRMCGE